MFEPVLSRWTTEELREAAEAVGQLVEHPGYRVLHRVIGEKKQKELDRLIYGGVVTHASYASLVSGVGGLDQVLHVAESVQYMAERRDQEEAEAARQAAEREAA